MQVVVCTSYALHSAFMSIGIITNVQYIYIFINIYIIIYIYTKIIYIYMYIYILHISKDIMRYMQYLCMQICFAVTHHQHHIC